MNNLIEYSVVIPVYNSSKTIGKLIKEIDLNLNSFSHEIICVNDASEDDSFNKINELIHTSSIKLKCIHLPVNSGQHYATAIGIVEARGKYIITIDDDLQYNASSIRLLIEEINKTNVEVVYGLPLILNKPLFKKLVHIFFYHSSIFIGKKRKKASSFRLILAHAVQFLSNQPLQKYIYLEAEFAIKIKKTSYVYVQHNKREEGKSNYTLKKLFNMYIRIINHYVLKKK